MDRKSTLEGFAFSAIPMAKTAQIFGGQDSNSKETNKEPLNPPPASS